MNSFYNRQIKKYNSQNYKSDNILVVGDVHGDFLQAFIPLKASGLITDVEFKNDNIEVVFNDNIISTTQGWTSEKIKNEIDTKSSIDDTTTSTTSSWSSSKTSAEISTATTDMATQTWVSSTFEPKNGDLLTKTNADTLYEPKNADLLTKTEASQTYEPKNADLATKTWVGQQGYLTEHQSLDECIKHSEVYVQNGILYINL